MNGLLAAVRLDWLAAAMVLGFSGAAAYHDLRTGRIPNRLLKAFMLAVVLWLWTVFLVVGLLHHDPGVLRPRSTFDGFLWATLKNTGIAFAVGLALWFGRLWAAGDAKLFPLMAAALPFGFYSHQYVELWPAFVLFYNSVMASALVVLLDLAWRGVTEVHARLRHGPDAAEHDAARPPFVLRALRGIRENGLKWAQLVLVFLFLLIFIKAVRHVLAQFIGLAVTLDPTLLYVVLFFTCHPLIRFMQRYRAVLIAAAAIDIVLVVLALTGAVPGLTLRMLLGMSFIAIGLISFRLLYDAYQNRMDFRKIEVDDLRAKMILAEEHMMALKGDGEYFKSQELDLGPLLPDGLKPDQVPLVQRWWRERLPGAVVRVQKTFPMGPTLFIGAVLTIILHDYVIRLPR